MEKTMQESLNPLDFDLFGELLEEGWKKEWVGMPEFVQKDCQPCQQITLNFEFYEDVVAFGKLLGQNVSPQTNSMWFPKQDRIEPKNFLYETPEPINPKYPIYIISKGRWESRLTSKIFEKRNIPYQIVVEPSEYEQYANVINPNKILRLPEDFSKLGQGSIPVRNWVWEHSIKEGWERHWIWDDNISNLLRLNNNRKLPVADGAIFRACEDFTNRYENVAFSGFNNIAFAPDRSPTIPPFYLNTRIYSMTLIKNDLPYRWRGRYNEDTDICIRALKDGWCTILFNAFLGDKATTMTQKGGNTDTIYNTGDQRREFAESLKRQHPDIVEVVWKFNRWHHQVDYSGFKKNKLIKKPNLAIKEGVDNYGMILKQMNLPLDKAIE